MKQFTTEQLNQIIESLEVRIIETKDEFLKNKHYSRQIEIYKGYLLNATTK